MINDLLKDELKNINSLKQDKIFARVSEAAEIFSLSKSYIWSLLASGQLKFYKISPKITLIKITDMFDFIKKSTEVQ
ncbi:helix-turn-helix domain-containing protein [Aliarcobacter cryaerophilus]|uniref:helix-turn-helix domain-containing protein n=1 Tax=Aliarcobacter cryaerophilus TaxID=28198 RepID=UPI00164C06D1|nr:helix-turn-helix domain-containing protein [Aliarcobacter cryaerophilus]QNK85602.1 helix-turn-helix domain-containing protein [Aliarcobacter cryaerophilus]